MTLAHKLERERYDALRKVVGEAYKALDSVLPRLAVNQHYPLTREAQRVRDMLKTALLFDPSVGGAG